MAKVTVYLTDDQLERLKAAKGFGRGGVSKMFQAFVDAATVGGVAPSGRYDYARKLMPIHAAIERHATRLARKVQAGGPPADGGPVAAALAVLLYKRVLEADPALAAEIDKEFTRFGLDELVAAETEGVDLLAEADEGDDDEEDEVELGLGGLGTLGLRLGDEVRDAVRQQRAAFRSAMRELHVDDLPRGARANPRPRPERRRERRHLHVEVTPDDDPRDLLSVTDFATFRERHADWVEGARLTPSQVETVRELLIRRAGGDPTEDDAPDAPDDRGGDPGDAGGPGDHRGL